MKIFSKSDIGLVRSSNQDSCNADYFPGNSAWAVVCDGMGGANGGDIASKVAVDVITNKIKELYKTNPEEIEKYTKILYAQAKLIEGLTLDNPSEISDLICEALSK